MPHGFALTLDLELKKPVVLPHAGDSITHTSKHSGLRYYYRCQNQCCLSPDSGSLCQISCSYYPSLSHRHCLNES